MASGGAGASAGGPPGGLLYSVTLEGDKFVRREREPSVFHKSFAGEKTYIGCGEFSRVHISEDKTYIIKHICATGIAPYDLLLANAEINALMKLKDSPYVVKLLAAEVYDDHAYIVYPYIPGETLENWLYNHHTVVEKERIKSELTAGLKDIHAAGLLHRDIKKDNIFIPFDSNRPAFYLDFGLVVAIDSEQFSKGVKASQEKNFSKKKQTIDRNTDPLSDILQMIDNSHTTPERAAAAVGDRPPSPEFSPYGGARRTRRRLGPARNRTRGQRKVTTRRVKTKKQRAQSAAGRG